MIAFVTGASSGIGRDIARELAAYGFNLIISARRIDRLRELKKEITEKYGVKVKIITADLGDEKQVLELHRRVKKYDVDVVINNAGFGVFGDFTESDLSRELDMLDVNIKAFHTLFKLFTQDFAERDYGYILNVGSSAGFMPGPLFSSYYASKAYILRMTEAVFTELAAKHSAVRVSVLCPGPVDTEFSDRARVHFTMPAQSSEFVAKYAVSHMFDGECVICPSVLIKAGLVVSRLLPEQALSRLTMLIQSKKEQF